METSPSPQRLYSHWQIALATFLGSPLAASWFFARNFRQLGQTRTANQTLVAGILGTATLLVVAYFVPDDFPFQAIPIGLTVGLRQSALQVHGEVVRQHVSSGGRLGSWWEVIGISLVCLVVILVLIFGAALFMPTKGG